MKIAPPQADMATELTPPTEVFAKLRLVFAKQFELEGECMSLENRLVAALGEVDGPIVIVSNEVGSGIVPDNKLARAFRDAQGQLNQRVAAIADHVVLVTAGIPLTLK